MAVIFSLEINFDLRDGPFLRGLEEKAIKFITVITHVVVASQVLLIILQAWHHSIYISTVRSYCNLLVCVHARVRVRRFLCNQMWKDLGKCTCKCVRKTLFWCGCTLHIHMSILQSVSSGMTVESGTHEKKKITLNIFAVYSAGCFSQTAHTPV